MTEARALYAELCREHPDDAECWFLLGAANGQLGLFEETIDCCRRAIAIRPDHAEAHFNLGIATQRLGRLKEAGDYFRAAIKLKPDYVAAIECFKEVALRTSGDKTLTVALRGGVRICVPDSLQLMTPYVLLEQEDWFEDEIGFVRRLIRTGAQVVDIGANYGVYTLTMATCTGPSGKVWAFEPASTTASYLKKSIHGNGASNIHLIQAALSNHRGTARLALNENSELNALGQTSDSGMGEIVPLLTLDGCAREYDWRDIEFIKLDAEGEEGNIIEGGNHFLSTQSPLIMFELKHADKVNLALINQFLSLGYATYRLIPGLNLLAPFDLAEPLDPYQLNLFCCKPDRARRLEADGLIVIASDSSPAMHARDDVWKDRILELPYAKEARQHWLSGTSNFSTLPGGKHYRNALNSYALAHTESLSPASRHAALKQALAEIDQAVRASPTVARVRSFARMAWEAGQRAAAIQALDRLVNRGAGTLPDPHEPFLAVSPRFDSVDPAGSMEAWCQASILTQYARLKGYSSYFTGTGTLKILETLRANKFACAEMERRYQLIRMRHGMQEGPEYSPLLAAKSEENLNFDFWSVSK